jgi:AcrR family transcriptional regulator
MLNPMPGTRKTPKTWIDAGLSALKSAGPEGLRAETLARQLETTKGSFYWHFKDVPAFHDAVLAEWATQARKRFEAAVNSGETEVTRLRGLGRFRQTPLDRAVRAWAVQDRRARKEVAQIDALMLSVIAELLRGLDATHPDFPGLIHAVLVAGPASGSHAETLIDLLLVLK